jgi:hypothetical protein
MPTRTAVPFLLCLFSAAVGGLRAQDDQALVRQLLREKDDAELLLVQKVAALRTRAAAEGLIQAFDQCSTLLFRREIVRALSGFGEVPEAQQPALTKLAEIAGSVPEDELRSMAIGGLAQSRTIGKSLLQKLVDMEIPDAVREPAMRAHVGMATADDAPWYRQLWNLEQKQRKDKNGQIAPPEANAIRLLAFQGLLPQLTEQELADAMKRETDAKIRRAALAWMDQKGMPKAAEVAEWVFERVGFPGADRAEAARIVLTKGGPKAAGKFFDLAKKRDVTPEDLRLELARLLAELRDDAVDKRAVKLLGKGKPHEKVFAIHATARVDDPKVLATVRKGLADPALEVRVATAEVLGKRRDRDALPILRKMLEDNRQPGDARLAVEAIHAIEGTTTAWLRELAALTAHADREVRNTAVELLGKARDRQQIGTLLTALEHADWSTRLAAVEAVAALRDRADKAVVEKLVERIGKEEGRLRLRIGEALWRLTAQDFDENATMWAQWWASAKETFKVATEKELDAAEEARQLRRLRQRTQAPPQFFGIKVESHRVIFVVDVSGSMMESMYGRTVDKRPAARTDVAKQELAQAVRNLEPGALFNVFAFSSGVQRWQKEGIGSNTAQSRQDALTFIERLGASGGTNLYDSLKEAFADPDVDTIFVLSDGEPTEGEVTDAFRIREDVAFWNAHRKVRIHTIAVGGNLEVLEWLAKDSGGNHLQMR